MKKFFAVMFGVTFFALPLATAQHGGHEHGTAHQAPAAEATQVKPAEKVKIIYKCPMHAEEVSTEGGKCPKCGMQMTQAGKAVAYHCPMHTDVVSDKPGMCPKCNRTMVPERFEGSKK